MFFKEVTNMNEIKYKHNYITNVILQIEFLKNDALSLITNSSILEIINKNFPTQEIDTVVNEVEVKVDNESDTANANKLRHIKKSFSRDYNCKLSVVKKMLSLECNNYVSFKNFYENIQEILKSIFTEFNDEQTIRIGLRYVNMFQYEKSLKNYFNEHLKNYISFYTAEKDSENKLSRAINRAEFISEGKRLVLQYGFYNPSYPSILNKQDFVLDIDTIDMSVFSSYDEVDKAIQKSHDLVCNMFENCISDKLRGKLNE